MRELRVRVRSRASVALQVAVHSAMKGPSCAPPTSRELLLHKCFLAAPGQDGERDGRFSNSHGGSRVTAVTLDTNERRLVTAANDASIHMWNFNNGSLLRRQADLRCW